MLAMLTRCLTLPPRSFQWEANLRFRPFRKATAHRYSNTPADARPSRPRNHASIAAGKAKPDDPPRTVRIAILRVPPYTAEHSIHFREPAVKAVVSAAGVLIPRRMLRGVKEVEIRKSGRNIVVEPAGPADDPIFTLGTAPVRVGTRSGAAGHDAHLYAPA